MIMSLGYPEWEIVVSAIFTCFKLLNYDAVDSVDLPYIVSLLLLLLLLFYYYYHYSSNNVIIICLVLLS